MKIYLLRHAIAVDPGTAGFDEDSQRPLTEKGRKRMRQIARGMHIMDVSIDRVLSSPFVRARQTAKLVAREFGLKKDQVSYSQSLTPLGYPDQLIEEINKDLAGVENLLLVGHDPCLGELAGVLAMGAPSAGIHLKKGGLCRLSAETLRFERCARLDWLMTPAQLAALGK